MLSVTVVSPQAAAIRRQLAPALPGASAVHYCRSAADVDAAALQCEIAFGAPDALAPLLPSMPRLRWLQSTWAGVTPLLQAGRRDYLLTGVKGLFGRSMAEYVLGWLLALQRNVIVRATTRHWLPEPERGLAALRLGIAGVGSIGAEVAQRCAPFVAEVVGLNSDGRPVPACARCFPASAIRDFAAGLDALVLLLPDTAATDGLVDAAVIARLNPGAVLINAGRANALRLPDALAALSSGALAALVLDVLEEEPLPAEDALWRTRGVYLTSHTAAPTDVEAITRLFVDNLARYRAGRPLAGLIDFQRGY